MARVFFLLAVVLFLGQATGVMTLAAQVECIENCPDERLDSQCAPLCMCFTCAARHKPLTTVEQIALPEQRFLQYMPLHLMRVPTSPMSFKIFHVPKHALA
jgi:hypothetical protein